MLLSTLLLEHLTEASESGTSGLSNDNFGILESTLNERPERVEMGLNEEGATFYDDTECGNGGFAKSSVGRRGESANLLEQRREDLSGRKGSGEDVDNSEGGTRGNVVVNIDRLGFSSDGKKGSDDRTSEVELLNLRLLEFDNPEERVEGHDSEIVVVVGVG